MINLRMLVLLISIYDMILPTKHSILRLRACDRACRQYLGLPASFRLDIPPLQRFRQSMRLAIRIEDLDGSI